MRKFLKKASIVVITAMFFLFFLETADRIICSVKFRSASYLLYPFFEKGSLKVPSVRRIYYTEIDGITRETAPMPAENLAPSKKLGITYNSHGFRGLEFQTEKPPGTVRIFCTGGSSTFSSECPDGATYADQLAVLFKKRNGTGINYEVINAGFAGYNTDNIIPLIKTRLTHLAPDTITVCEAFNDIGRMTLILDSFWKRTFWNGHRLLFQRSLLYTDLLLLGGRRGIESAARAAYSSVRQNEYAENLITISRAIRAAGAKPVFILQPVLLAGQAADKTSLSHMVDRNEGASLEKEFLQTISGLHHTFLNIMKDVAHGENVLLVDPRRAFMDHDNTPSLFYDYLHLSPAGSKLMAQVLFDTLTSEDTNSP